MRVSRWNVRALQKPVGPGELHAFAADHTFDALAGNTYRATVNAIGLTPTVSSGVVTYKVTFSLDASRLSPGTPVPAPAYVKDAGS